MCRARYRPWSMETEAVLDRMQHQGRRTDGRQDRADVDRVQPTEERAHDRRSHRLAFTTSEIPQEPILDWNIGQPCPQEASGAPDMLDPSDVPLVLLGRHAGVVVLGSSNCRERVQQNQRAGPFRTGRRIQDRHRARQDGRKQDDIVESRGRHHRVQVVGPTLQRRQLRQRPDPTAPSPARRTPWTSRTTTAAQTTGRVGAAIRDRRDPGSRSTTEPTRCRAARPRTP
jgi:hypothetical protein